VAKASCAAGDIQQYQRLHFAADRERSGDLAYYRSLDDGLNAGWDDAAGLQWWSAAKPIAVSEYRTIQPIV
jgi:hypothetical protein